VVVGRVVLPPLSLSCLFWVARPKNKDRRFTMVKFQLFSGKIYKVSTTEWLFMERYIKEIATIVVDTEDMKDMGEITECNHTQKSNLPSYRSHKFV
jgi:hypothetical protein